MKITPASHRTGAWRRIAALAGEPAAPPGSTPAPDCCEPGTPPPDRAHEDTTNAWMLSSGGTPALVQSKAVDSLTTFDFVLDDTPAEGNLLVAWVTIASFDGTVAPDGFTAAAAYVDIPTEDDGSPSATEIHRGRLYYRVVENGDTDTFAVTITGSNVRVIMAEFTGGTWTLTDSDTAVDQTDVSGPDDIDLDGGTVTPTAGVPTLLFGGFGTGQGAADPVGTFTPGTDYTSLGAAARTNVTAPVTMAQYRVIEAPTGSYNVTGTSTISSGISRGMGGSAAAFAAGDPGWFLQAPLTVDDDDATYETIVGTDLLRVDLGAEFRIVRTRIRIAGTTSGARVITIKGANLADFSDEVTLATIAFTATGGLTAQDVTGLWATDDSYRFFELSIGTSDTYRVHSWELYEQTPGTIVVNDPTNGDAPAELQEVLDNLGAESAGPHIADTTDAHDASAVSFDPTGLTNTSATDVQEAIEDLDAAVSGGGIPATIVDAKGDLIVGTADDMVDNLTAGTNGYALVADSTETTGLKWVPRTVAIVYVIDGGGSTIPTGVAGFLSIPFACTITGARLLADQSGEIVIDVWNDTYANYPPTDADSITASAPPTISGPGVKSEDTTLTGWDPDVAAGDILGFNVDSVTSIERVTLTLTATRV